MDINNENLESALTNTQASTTETTPQMPKEMEIGFHQGSLTTLAGERHALVEMIGNVETRMQAHSKRLEELGVVAEKKE